MTIQNNDTQSINIVLLAIQRDLEDLKNKVTALEKEIKK